MPEPVAAIEVGCLAARALGRGAPGRVAAVFERSVYIVTGRQWICIGAPSLGAGPLNVRCDPPDAVDWRAGDPVRIGEGQILIAPHWSVRLDAAPVWTPHPPGAWSRETSRRGLRALDRIVDSRVPDQGLGRLIGGARRGARLPPVAAAGFGPLAALGRAARAEVAPVSRSRAPDLTRILPAIGPLIGLGPGLTPSGDDALGGALVALHALGRDRLRDAIWQAVEPALGYATNDISLAHLRAAAMGYGSAALHDILGDIMAGAAENLAARLDAVDAIGHTSGWDALAGATAVLRAVAENERI